VRGEIAIASAKLAYQHYKRTITGDAWQKLADAGARPQRLLWASTSTKDPSFSKVKYVDSLIAPYTINTLPQKTLIAYRDEGKPEIRLEQNPETAIEALSKLAKLGIDLGATTQQLEDEGVQKFIQPFDLLLDTLKERLADK
jgi:transaldolase/transaldolase/glucose-6-phosphate isomerase